jgi:hypothetical protein
MPTIDFTAVVNREQKPIDLAAQHTLDDLRRATNESIDYLLEILQDLNDDDVTFDPDDPNADDPYAVAGEESIGWSLAHLVAHVTATCEEWAAYSSLLARGIAYPADPRLRFETPWREITTQAQCVQRLEESRRMRLAYLDTWPDEPNYDTYRELSPRFIERVGPMNAPASFLFGLSHEIGHYEQFEDVRKQALQARQNA